MNNTEHELFWISFILWAVFATIFFITDLKWANFGMWVFVLAEWACILSPFVRKSILKK